MNEMDVIDFSQFNGPYSLAFLFDGLFWAEKTAAPAAVTEFGEYKDIIFKDGYGIVGTNFCTLTAIVAFFFDDLWDGEKNRFARVNAWLQEKMGVGFFNIAVQKLDEMIVLKGKG
jgi:hypothetical protein